MFLKFTQSGIKFTKINCMINSLDTIYSKWIVVKIILQNILTGNFVAYCNILSSIPQLDPMLLVSFKFMVVKSHFFTNDV